MGDQDWILPALYRRLGDLTALVTAAEVARLLAEPRYQDPLRIEPFGFKAYSRLGEDGMLAETFHRLGSAVVPTLVESGVDHGL